MIKTIIFNFADCSLLLCYPSENLRKLVPENILSASCIVQPPAKLQGSGEGKSTKKTQAQLDSDSQTSASQMNTQKDSRDALFTDNTQKSNETPGVSGDISKSKDSGISREMEINANCLLSRPAMAFITQQHDLEKLRYYMKRTLRIATCRIYSLQALNWLIRSVTQPVCLHDLMWWFVASLSLSNVDDGPKFEEIVIFNGSFCYFVVHFYLYISGTSSGTSSFNDSNEWPYFSSLVTKLAYFSSVGSRSDVIAASWILFAAHCD